jgi:predicted secreted Zn-dependent protease
MKQLIFLMFLSISQGICAEPSVSIKTEYYNVKGSTPNAIRKDMNKKRSGKYDAYTKWHVTWRFNTKKNRSRECEISDINISLNIKFTLPQWKPDRAVNEEVKERWNDYYTALIDHENQHKDIAVEMAQEIEDTLGALDNENDCKNLRKTANDTAYKILNIYKKKQIDFDKETNHGINDGAHFP